MAKGKLPLPAAHAAPEPPRCGNCAHWEPTGWEDERPVGECRHSPPTLLGLPLVHKAVFPPTAAGVWCGQHKPRSAS